MTREYTPLVIAKSFTKKYYEIIHKKPQQLFRFYKDESNFFHGDDGQQNTETVTGSDKIRATIQELNLAGAIVDLTEGTIDAQSSDNNAVFLMVTGKFIMPGKSPRPFVQSFYLVCQNPGKSDAQPSYFVRNSVFRLFGDDADAKAEVVETTPLDTVTTAILNNEDVGDFLKENSSATATVKAPQQNNESDSMINEPVTKAEDVDASTVNSEPEYVNVSVKATEEIVSSTLVVEETVEEKPQLPAPEPVVKEKVPPASWARLVAGSSGPETVEPQQEELKPKKTAPKKDEEKKVSSSNEKSVALPHTLYLCQLRETVEEADVRGLLEVFGTIKKIDVHAHKGFAFVDFVDASAVKNAMAKEGTGYFTLKDSPVKVEPRQTKGVKGPGNKDNRTGGRTASGGGNRERQNGNGKGGSKNDKGGNSNFRNRNNGNKTSGNSKQAAK